MENIDSHVVLMSGGKDKRVNHFNSEYYYKRLLSLGKSSEYYFFPTANHNLGTPKATLFDMEKVLRIIKKFKK